MSESDDARRGWLMLADRLEAKIRQTEAYDSAEKLDFQSAVEIASVRIARILKFGRKQPGSAVYEGWLYFDDYLPISYSDADIEALIERSKTDYKARRVLAFVAYLNRNNVDFPSLRRWEAEDRLSAVKPPKAPTGQSDLANLQRDRIIVSEVERLIEAGFTATRNKANAGDSAVDVIVAALAENKHALSYDAVETIWSRRDSLRKVPFAAEIQQMLVKKFSS